MSARSLAGIGVAIAVVAACCALFFACFEKATLELPTPESREARENAHLAAGRLLAAMGAEVVVLDGPAELDRLPPGDVTLFFTVRRRTLTPARAASLRRWVESGGHLVVTRHGSRAGEDGDPLLAPLGLVAERSAPQGDEEPDCLEDETPGDAAECDPEAVSVDFAHFPGAPEPLALSFHSDHVWRDGDALDPVFRIPHSAGGDRALSLRVGKGLLSALVDDGFLHNTTIDALDHAEAVVRLARLDGRDGPVWIVASERWPGVWSRLARDARPLWASAALLLALFVWRAARRRGPLRPTPAPERRRWIEHLEAVGRYQWRRDRGRALLDANRGQALRVVAHARPGWATLSEPARDARIAAAIGAPPAAVSAALGAPAGDDEAAFLDSVRTLEALRKKL